MYIGVYKYNYICIIIYIYYTVHYYTHVYIYIFVDMDIYMYLIISDYVFPVQLNTINVWISWKTESSLLKPISHKNDVLKRQMQVSWLNTIFSISLKVKPLILPYNLLKLFIQIHGFGGSAHPWPRVKTQDPMVLWLSNPSSIWTSGTKTHPQTSSTLESGLGWTIRAASSIP